jgi:nucleoid-associated protein YgaU
MNRYINGLKITRNNNGKRYYTTVIPKDVLLDEFPREYISQSGDRWDSVAYKFYGNATLWYRLAAANGGANGSIFIKQGTIIKIPTR